MNQKHSFALYISFAIASAVLLVAVLISFFGGKTVIDNGFTKWTALVALAVISIGSVAGVVLYNGRLSVRSVAFYLVHMGFVLFLFGQLIYAVSGHKVSVAMPVDDGATYSRVETLDGDIIDLGFEFGLLDFKEELYEDGSPKHYEATLLLDEGEHKLTVNHPIHYNGYKIYLMSCYDGYDEETHKIVPYVSMLLKYDRSEFISTGGIIVTIIGAFLICFVRPAERAKVSVDSDGAGGKRKKRPAKGDTPDDKGENGGDKE